MFPHGCRAAPRETFVLPVSQGQHALPGHKEALWLHGARLALDDKTSNRVSIHAEAVSLGYMAAQWLSNADVGLSLAGNTPQHDLI